MSAAAVEEAGKGAVLAIERSEPVEWLQGCQSHALLQQQARTALEYFYPLAKEYAASCPLDRLLTLDFDYEQIWHQLDLQSVPLLRAARRHLNNLQRTVSDSVDHFDIINNPKAPSNDARPQNDDGNVSRSDAENEENQGDSEALLDEEDEEGAQEGDDMVVKQHALDDKFFKLKDMERFLNDEEAPQISAADSLHEMNTLKSDEDEEMEVNYMQDDKEAFRASAENNLKYSDFFGGEPRKKKLVCTSVEMTQNQLLTPHEKHLVKVQKHVKELERANLNSKLWTMQGEVSAAKRPKNSALEVELDFEHNSRPPPVITEEVTASLEDIIRARIAENSFDNVERKPSVALDAPKHQVELDEKKSQKGLAELYEDDFVQKTALTPISSSPADETRREATQLLKALFIKLDALSHFHFTPKPVIEDMAVQADVPALAMEEVAPMLVSDAQMLAPEEHFTGEGVVKADVELSREEKRRRRARKKVKSGARRRNEAYAKPSISVHQSSNSQRSILLSGKQRRDQSHYSKSMKVFEQLDETNKKGKKAVAQSKNFRGPFLKL